MIHTLKIPLVIVFAVAVGVAPPLRRVIVEGPWNPT